MMIARFEVMNPKAIQNRWKTRRFWLIIHQLQTPALLNNLPCWCATTCARSIRRRPITALTTWRGFQSSKWTDLRSHRWKTSMWISSRILNRWHSCSRKRWARSAAARRQKAWQWAKMVRKGWSRLGPLARLPWLKRRQGELLRSRYPLALFLENTRRSLIRVQGRGRWWTKPRRRR